MKTPVAIVGGGPGGSALAFLVHHRHPDFAVDLFAGRVYDDEENPAIEGMRQIKQCCGSWWDAEGWWDGSERGDDARGAAPLPE